MNDLTITTATDVTTLTATLPDHTIAVPLNREDVATLVLDLTDNEQGPLTDHQFEELDGLAGDEFPLGQTLGKYATGCPVLVDIKRDEDDVLVVEFGTYLHVPMAMAGEDSNTLGSIRLTPADRDALIRDLAATVVPALSAVEHV